MELGRVIILILLSLGLIQGMVYGLILFKSTAYNKTANRILAIILFLLSYRLLVQIMRLFGLGHYDGWYYVMLDLSWIHGALIYFYTQAQTQPGFRLQKKDWIHFLPLTIQVLFSIFVRLQNLYWDGTRESLTWLGYYGYVVWMNNSTIYIVASILILFYTFQSRKRLNALSDSFKISDSKIRWIKRIVHCFFVYFALVLLVLLIDLIVHQSANEGSYYYFTRFYYYPFFIGISILTYWIGLEGFARRNDPEIIVKPQPDATDLDRLRIISQKLEKAMQNDKLYREQGLSLNGLADKLDTKPYLISRTLSEIYNKRFNDFINEYRVKEVQSLIQDSDNSKFTLLSLAMKAGFNSKSSFNRAIKKQLGISPSELKFDK